MAVISPIIALGRVLALGLLTVCAGCSGAPFAFVGHWEGHRAVKGSGDTPDYVQFTANMVKLDILPDGTFSLFDKGMPETGDVSIDGNKAVLMVRKVMGMAVESQPKATQDSIVPVQLTGETPDKILYGTASDSEQPVELKRSATDAKGRP